MAEEDSRVASGQIKMEEFYSPASVCCVLGLKEELAVHPSDCNLRATAINEDLCLSDQWRTTVGERDLSCWSGSGCVCVLHNHNASLPPHRHNLTDYRSEG